MEKKVVKIGVVGMRRGRDVISNVVDDENIVLRAICDKDPDRLASAKKYFEEERHVKDLLCFDSLEDILASDIDAVYLATDATLHAGHAILAMEAGKHVISEIPAIDSIEDARKLKEAANAHPNVKYMVGENCCYWEFIQTWKKMYDDGKFGQAVYAESEYLHAGDITKINPDDYKKAHWRHSYNAIKYLTHNLGPLLYIMNDRCVSVTCMEPDVRYNPYKTGAETGVALFKTAKGAVIRILICFGAYVGFDHNFRICGTLGSIETDNIANLVDATSYAKLAEIPGTFEAKMEIPVRLGERNAAGHGGADAKMMRAFVDCIINDTKPPLDIDLGIAMSIPGIYAHESALQGGMPIEIPFME